jgi:hypothetical protein
MVSFNHRDLVMEQSTAKASVRLVGFANGLLFSILSCNSRSVFLHSLLTASVLACGIFGTICLLAFLDAIVKKDIDNFNLLDLLRNWLWFGCGTSVTLVVGMRVVSVFAMYLMYTFDVILDLMGLL